MSKDQEIQFMTNDFVVNYPIKTLQKNNLLNKNELTKMRRNIEKQICQNRISVWKDQLKELSQSAQLIVNYPQIKEFQISFIEKNFKNLEKKEKRSLIREINSFITNSNKQSANDKGSNSLEIINSQKISLNDFMDAFKNIHQNSLNKNQTFKNFKNFRNFKNFENIKFYKDMMKNLYSKSHKNMEKNNFLLKEEIESKSSKRLRNHYSLHRSTEYKPISSENTEMHANDLSIGIIKNGTLTVPIYSYNTNILTSINLSKLNPDFKIKNNTPQKIDLIKPESFPIRNSINFVKMNSIKISTDNEPNKKKIVEIIKENKINDLIKKKWQVSQIKQEQLESKHKRKIKIHLLQEKFFKKNNANQMTTYLLNFQRKKNQSKPSLIPLKQKNVNNFISFPSKNYLRQSQSNDVPVKKFPVFVPKNEKESFGLDEYVQNSLASVKKFRKGKIPKFKSFQNFLINKKYQSLKNFTHTHFKLNSENNTNNIVNTINPKLLSFGDAEPHDPSTLEYVMNLNKYKTSTNFLLNNINQFATLQTQEKRNTFNFQDLKNFIFDSSKEAKVNQDEKQSQK